MAGYTPLIYNNQDIWLNDIPFNYVDDNGCIWTISDIDGWWGLPDVDSEEDARPYTQDGSYFTEGRFPGRNITVTGNITPHFDASSTVIDPQVYARDLLNTRLNMVRSLGVFRVNEDPDKIAAVQLIGKPLTVFDKANNVLKFNFQLRASDPRKYSVTQKTVTAGLNDSINGRTYQKSFGYSYSTIANSDTFEVVNEGSFNTYGIFTIYGPVVDPYIEHQDSGKILKLKMTLGQGDNVTLNLNSRKITLNGTASRKNALTPESRWFVIEPGTNTLKFRGMQQIPADAGSPELTNFLPNPTLVAGIWTPEQYSGVSDYILSVDTTAGRRATPTSYGLNVWPNTSTSVFYQNTSTFAAVRNVGSISGALLSVTPGSTYTFSVWARGVSLGLVGGTIGADFYDDTSTKLSESISTLTFTAQQGEWTRMSTTITVPTNSTKISLRAAVKGLLSPTTTAMVATFTDAQLTIGSTLYDYFDGSFVNAAWLGSAGSSASTRAAIPTVPQAMVEFTYRDAWIE